MRFRQYALLLTASVCLAQDPVPQLQHGACDADGPSASPKERVKAARALKDGNADSIALLQPMLSDSDRDVRLEAVRTLSPSGPRKVWSRS